MTATAATAPSAATIEAIRQKAKRRDRFALSACCTGARRNGLHVCPGVANFAYSSQASLRDDLHCAHGEAVNLVKQGPRLVGREDEDISDAIQSLLEAEGIAVRTGAECIRFVRHEQGVAVGVNCAQGDPDVIGSHVLLAVGRRPNTDDLGLANAGVATDARGYIRVDDRLETIVPGIWALGDCNGRGAFTHTAYNDYEIVGDNLLTGADRRVTDRIPCYALYVDPPLGRVGITESEARALGKRITVGRRPMYRVARAREKDETYGLMKIVTDAETNTILGAAILGTGGDEAIHAVLDMMAAGGNATTLAHTMHIHPTVSELLPTIAGERIA